MTGEVEVVDVVSDMPPSSGPDDGRFRKFADLHVFFENDLDAGCNFPPNYGCESYHGHSI